jgi:glycosyltransferase involved in cell wall biosynthesis
MRILIAAYCPKQREGGVANVVYNTADSLRVRGHQVTCLFREDILPRPVAFPRFEAVYFAVRLARELRRRRAEFDLVNIHAPVGFAYGFCRSWLFRQDLPPYVMFLHGLEERRNHAMKREARKGRTTYFRWKNRVWQRVYHMPLFRWSITTADQAVVINRETWSMLQLYYEREIGRTWYVPNGIEPQFFLARDYQEACAQRLLFAGSWLDHKGIFYLSESFAALAKLYPQARLTIVGCGVAADTVKQSFDATVRDRVEVLPFVSRAEMPALYARHDVFVFPSLMEGLPIVLLEAMAAGMAVVTTETCGMMDIVEDEYNGLLVKPADSDAIVSAVERVIRSAELRRRLGIAAQETMRRHTWERVGAQLEKVFQLTVIQETRKYRE